MDHQCSVCPGIPWWQRSLWCFCCLHYDVRSSPPSYSSFAFLSPSPTYMSSFVLYSFACSVLDSWIEKTDFAVDFANIILGEKVDQIVGVIQTRVYTHAPTNPSTILNLYTTSHQTTIYKSNNYYINFETFKNSRISKNSKNCKNYKSRSFKNLSSHAHQTGH